MIDPSPFEMTRASYDTVAADYAELVGELFTHTPMVDRALLGVFAELVGSGPTADIGCGPGHVTAHLSTLGAEVFGIDLSPGMIDVARRRYPHLRFEVGSMTDLHVPDAALGEAGLMVDTQVVRQPDGYEKTPQGFVLAHRPEQPHVDEAR